MSWFHRQPVQPEITKAEVQKIVCEFAERLLAVIDVHLRDHGNVVLQSQALREMIREALDGKD